MKTKWRAFVCMRWWCGVRCRDNVVHWFEHCKPESCGAISHFSQVIATGKISTVAHICRLCLMKWYLLIRLQYLGFVQMLKRFGTTAENLTSHQDFPHRVQRATAKPIFPRIKAWPKTYASHLHPVAPLRLTEPVAITFAMNKRRCLLRIDDSIVCGGRKTLGIFPTKSNAVTLVKKL